MPSQADFADTYRALPDGPLQQLAADGGLTREAKIALAQELRTRNLTKHDFATHPNDAPQTQLEKSVQEKTFWAGRGRTGIYLFGKHYLNQADREQDIQLRTKWFTFASLPLIPLGSFRFKCEQKSFGPFHWNTQQSVIEQVPIYWKQVILTWLKALLFIAAMLSLGALLGWINHRR